MAVLLLGGQTETVYRDFKQFLVENGVVTTSAGVIVGIATYTFVRSVAYDVLMPAINVIAFGGIRFIHTPSGDFLSHMFQNVDFRWLNFLQETVAWIVVLFATFFILQYVLVTITKHLSTKPGSGNNTDTTTEEEEEKLYLKMRNTISKIGDGDGRLVNLIHSGTMNSVPDLFMPYTRI